MLIVGQLALNLGNWRLRKNVFSILYENVSEVTYMFIYVIDKLFIYC